MHPDLSIASDFDQTKRKVLAFNILANTQSFSECRDLQSQRQPKGLLE